MPANLPPQYVELEKEYRKEKDPRLRLDLLQRMLREIPKHKGTSHLVGELKHKISKLKVRIEKPPKHGATRHVAFDHVPREGAGRFAVVGPPNTGKSSILGFATRARVEIAEWPFTTRRPVAGMAMWENVHLQLIDTPPIAREHCESYVFNIMRTADVAVLVLSLGDDDLLEEYEYVVGRIHEGKVRLEGLVEPDPRYPTAIAKPTLVAATGIDRPDAEVRLSLLRDTVRERVSVWPLCSLSGQGFKEFLGAAFAMLDLVRAYTKTPGHPPDLNDPVLLPRGATVGDAAHTIHKELQQKLHYARVWGKNTFDGQRVTADHIVEDGDILEFHV